MLQSNNESTMGQSLHKIPIKQTTHKTFFLLIVLLLYNSKQPKQTGHQIILVRVLHCSVLTEVGPGSHCTLVVAVRVKEGGEMMVVVVGVRMGEEEDMVMVVGVGVRMGEGEEMMMVMVEVRLGEERGVMVRMVGVGLGRGMMVGIVEVTMREE